jgi:hypothetical protein
MKTLKPFASLFSDTVDDPIVQTIRRIQSQHTRFKTDFIGVEGAVAVQLEAWRMEDSQAWAIDRFTYVPAAGCVEKSVEARSGLCFFDALYHCARFQATELTGHKDRQVVSVPDGLRQDVISYREAAEAAFQVIDHDGKAHPCAQGRILTSGLFTPEMIALAAKTQDQPMAIQTPALSPMGETVSMLLAVNGRAIDETSDPIQRYRAQRMPVNVPSRSVEEDRRFDGVQVAGQNLIAGMQELAKHDFQDRIPKLAASLTLGIVPAIGYWRGSERYAHRCFSVLHQAFMAAAQGLPDCEQKTIALDFARAAERSLWLGRAAGLLLEDRRPGRHSEARLNKALRCLEQGSAAAALPPVDAARLQALYLDQTPEPKVFMDELNKSWQTASKAIQLITHGLDPDLAVGQAIADGSIFGGMSYTTGTMMFVAPEPDSLNLHKIDWQTALDSVAALRNLHGHDGSRQKTEKDFEKAWSSGRHDHGWRLPTYMESYQLRDMNKEDLLKKLFNGRYWTSREFYGSAWNYDFNTNKADFINIKERRSACCVRTL